jgi:hypothetical protein
MSFASRVERLRREYCRVDADELVTTVAADFINAAAPSFARAFDRKGSLVGTFDRLGEETLTAFRERVRSEAQGLAQAARVIVGGVGAFGGAMGVGGLPRGAVTLPDIPLHASQREAVELIERARRVALVCGRRWGKSTVIVTLAVEPHVTDGRVKISRSALGKRTSYRGVTANHLVRQVTGFRAFDKDAYRREDDLFDAAMYAALVSLGDGTEARWSRLKRAA